MASGANRIHLFEALRNAASFGDGKPQVQTPVFFQVLEGAAGFSLRVVDKKGADLDADYRAFSGIEREILKAFGEVRWSWDAGRVWGEEEFDRSGILLHEHSHLVWMLARSGKVVDADMKPLVFHPDPARCSWWWIWTMPTGPRVISGCAMRTVPRRRWSSCGWLRSRI